MSPLRSAPSAPPHPTVAVSTCRGHDLPMVKVAGEIDLATAPLLDRHLTAAIGPGHPEVVVDLCGVSFMDASGLAVLVRADNRARLHGGRVHLTGIPRHLARLLHATRLYCRFAAYEEPGRVAG